MKKALIAVGAVVFLGLVAFMWLLSGASPDNAPQDVKTIELPDAGAK